MSAEQPNRLSQISTMWTQLARTQDQDADPDRTALAELVERYHPAAYSYLLACTGREDDAADLFQEFALKLLRGEFRRADPSRGQFRDYLKITLANLIRKHAGRVAREARPGGDDLPEVADSASSLHESDEVFLAGWRKALLDKTWDGLKQVEAESGTPYHTALRTRADYPDDSSAELADRLTAKLRPPTRFTDTGVRKLLQRGREVFVDLVVAETARSVPTDDRERLERELIVLGFHGYCKPALDRWRPGR
ncbi:MAG: polymerase sigma factor, sigma-70 family [Gemmataceae bacterium]|nr:polymerase sigma factor, sigma-70 family [Gemmataceae bacterium]